MLNLRIPGPTPCPPEVLRAVARQMIDHRGPAAAALLQRLDERLRHFFDTTQPVALLTCSGTGGLEAALVNTLSPGDPVLSVSVGAFGDRFHAIAERYGAAATRMQIEWGQAADPAAVGRAVRDGGDYAAVLITHNETSTGVTNPLAEICDAIRAESDALILVDAVSSLGSIPLQTDAWGIDVVVTASQKGWCTPPGIAMASMSERALAASRRATMPRFYLDLPRHLDGLRNGQPPWTPALSILYGLDVALDLMAQEGRGAIFARHARIAQRGAGRRQGAGPGIVRR